MRLRLVGRAIACLVLLVGGALSTGILADLATHELEAGLVRKIVANSRCPITRRQHWSTESREANMACALLIGVLQLASANLVQREHGKRR